MIDYVTRGLAMLADEAEPAPIDSHEVIARARARTRTRRAVTAAAVATVAAVSSLVMTVGNTGSSTDPAPTSVATPPESLADQLNRLLRDALPEVIPVNWTREVTAPSQDPPLTFLCIGTGCVAHATYNDGAGDIDIQFHVDNAVRDWDAGCDPQYCTMLVAPVRKDLRDGTRTQVRTFTEKPTSRDIQELLASRPDGTWVSVSVMWPQGQRSKPAMTTREILKFATLFTYDASRDVGIIPTTETRTDDPNRASRLTQDLTEVLAEVVPTEWVQANEGTEPDEPPLTFGCTLTTRGPDQPGPAESESCWTYGYYRDGTGTIRFMFSVSQNLTDYNGVCAVEDCVEQTLPDGTETKLWTTTQPDELGEYFHEVAAIRPDGTCVWVSTSWTDQRSSTPITNEELLKIAMTFTL